MAKQFSGLTDGINLDLTKKPEIKSKAKVKTKEPVKLDVDKDEISQPKVRKSATISVEANDKLQEMLATLFTKLKVDLRRINESRLIELAIMEWEPSEDTIEVYNRLVENDRRLKNQ